MKFLLTLLMFLFIILSGYAQKGFTIGANFYLGEKVYLDGLLSFAYGVKDINAPDWQIPDADGEYDASHNAFGGLKVGLVYVLFGG